MIDIEKFISEHVTKRSVSMFSNDIENNRSELYNRIHNKSVLVIGGAGTIGSSYIKALLPFEPKSLVVVDINENGLTELTRDLRGTEGLYMPDEYITYPMSYSDPVFFKMFECRNGFDIVANFSAHKHVRSEKDLFSVEALIYNNVINAKKLLDAMVAYPPEYFFCVSTDKAANPVNIMGASKKIMEDMIMSYSEMYPVTTARFANVAFSNGSLPAGFLDRVAKRQPISAPSDVQRYFVSPEESGQICLLACILGNSGEIFFPKLETSQMMKFSDMATRLLKEYGYDIHECDSDKDALTYSNADSSKYPVHYSKSDTSGEKAYEEFYTDGEDVDFERYGALGVIVNLPKKKRSQIVELINDFTNLFNDPNSVKSDVISAMKSYLINFEHIETGKSLDSKM